MINLNQLYTFFVVVNSGSLSKASERLFITEPAISLQIKSLEQQIGYRLLDRIGKELKPTDLGQLVYEYCKKIFSFVQELDILIENFKDTKSGILKLGMAKSLLNYFMPTILPPFMEKYPAIKVLLEEDSTMSLLDGLINRNYELVLSARIPYPKKLVDFVPFTRSNLYFIGPPKNFLDLKEPLKIEQLHHLPIIGRDKRSAIRYIMMNILQRAGIKPRIFLEVANTELIKELVKEGKGFSFLPDLCIREEIKKGELRIIPIEGLNLSFEIDIFFLRKRTLSPQAKLFLDYLLSIKKDEIYEIVDDLAQKLRLAMTIRNSHYRLEGLRDLDKSST